MKTKFYLTLSAAALLVFAAPAFATPDTAAPAEATIEATQPSQTAPAAMDAAAPAEAPAADANAMTTPESSEAAHEDASGEEGGHHEIAYPQVDWSWNGPFGTFDRASMQRGFQVYKQVCAACHSLNRVSFRNLSALGYNEAEIKSIAAEATIMDGPNDDGEMFERPGRPSDHFKAPFANDNAARAANGGALPPDLSLITRARADGSNYIPALLTGYKDAPAGFTLNEGMNYNEYFAGNQIAMPAPLVDDAVTYEDGTPATVDQMSKDVTTFLTWASEPVMEKRKQTGIKVMLFLLVFAGLMYATKRRVWKDIH